MGLAANAGLAPPELAVAGWVRPGGPAGLPLAPARAQSAAFLSSLAIMSYPAARECQCHPALSGCLGGSWSVTGPALGQGVQSMPIPTRAALWPQLTIRVVRPYRSSLSRRGFPAQLRAAPPAPAESLPRPWQGPETAQCCKGPECPLLVQELDLGLCSLHQDAPPPPVEALALQALALPGDFAVHHRAWLAGLSSLRRLGLSISNELHKMGPRVRHVVGQGHFFSVAKHSAHFRLPSQAAAKPSSRDPG